MADTTVHVKVELRVRWLEHPNPSNINQVCSPVSNRLFAQEHRGQIG